jgi:hypothetical protein
MKREALKVLSNTQRNDRKVIEISAFTALDEVPPPPDWLINESAVSEWNRLAPILVRYQMLNVGNVTMLQHLCAIHGWMVKAWQSDEPPTAAFLTAYRLLSTDLGLSGMALKIPNPVKASRFTKLVDDAL